MNFCAGCLDPSVSTNKPEADGREVTNLISQNPGHRRLGYIAEYFIRPPVDVIYKFTVPIDISHVKLSVKLENKCSTGFVVFTQPENSYISKFQSQEEKVDLTATSTRDCTLSSSSCSSEYLNTNYVPSASVSNPITNVDDSYSCENEDDGSVYFRVGSYFTNGEDCLLLKNPYYKHWINIKMPSDDAGNDDLRVYNGTLRHSNRWALRCVKKMIVRISRTFGSTQPVLKAVEIWGQPGISTKKDMRKSIVRKWLDQPHTENTAPLVPRIYNSDPEEKKQDSADGIIKESEDSFEIPEDFLDPLTCDVMTIPLLLPSGHSVDAHSLERFIANEAIWGRPAADPFTGIPFKPGQMPSPNVSLKARIDRFLLMNADSPQVQSCGRTLGATGNTYFGSVGASISDEQNFNHNPKRKHYNTKGVESDSKRKHVSGNASRAGNTNDEMQDKLECSENHDILKVNFPGSINKTISPNAAECSLENRIDEARLKGDATGSSKLIFSDAKKPAQCSTSSQKSFHTHHGLIHMIGNALSRTQQRTDGVKSSSRSLLGKPPSLIHGDANKNCNITDIIIKKSASCECGTKNSLYRVPCNHVICRKCLLNEHRVSEVKCKVCEEVWKKSDVVRFHEKSIFS